jgi:Tol biopolymer transport system component/DNA-binding winged helix-turn-helix (wHTH) protein
VKDVKNRCYRFDQVEIDVQNLRVTVSSEIRPLEPKSFRLLLFLVENPNRAIPKDEIIATVWGSTFVSDNSLTKMVAQIRKALDDDPKAPRYIETVPTVGYRFVAQIDEEVEEEVGREPAQEHVAPATPAAPVPSQPFRVRERFVWRWVLMAVGVLLVLNAGLWFVKFRTAPLPPQKLVPVTTYEGAEKSPAFSPDGRQVAFYWDGEKGVNPGIYVKLLGEPNALRLTSGPDGYPVWSPDGKRIAFVRGLELGGPPVGHGIYTVSALGGPERKVRDIEVRGEISWSPDGKWLALAQGGAFHSAIFILSTEGGEPRRVPNPNFRMFDDAPAFSPDGSSLAFANCVSRYICDIYLQQLRSDGSPDGNPRQIAHPGLGIYSLAWSRDGRSLIYPGVQNFGTLSYLWRTGSDGRGSPQRIEISGPRASAPSASLAAARLVFENSLEDPDIWRYNTDGSSEVKPLITSSLWEYAPQYSPDGTKIVFCSDRAGEGTEIWVTQADGSRPVEMTRGPGVNQGTPRWSPDGHWIAFDSYAQNGHPGIWVIEADGSSPRRVTPESWGGANSPFWSPDGNWIYFNGKGQIWRIPFTGGPVEQITKHGSGTTAYVSADNSTLFYMKGNVGPVYAQPLSGGEERQILSYVYYKAFFPIKDGIYYVGARRDDGFYPLEFYEFTGKTSRLLGKVGGHLWQGLTVSPDGKSILLSRSANTGSDLMMIDNF